MNPHPGIAAAFAALLLACPCAARAQDEASAAALQQWVAAVREHKPGKPDAAASTVASMSYAERRQLHPAMETFLHDLHSQTARSRSPAQAQILELVRSVKENPGVGLFLRRAVILHTDAAVYESRLPSPPDDAPAQPVYPPATGPGSRRNPLAPPPLLSNERFLVQSDARVVGTTPATWHWPFARYLVDQLLAPAVVPQDDHAFAVDWYHAVAAFLFAIGNHGDANDHLHYAIKVLPDEARVVFDLGCYDEILGLPLYQALSADPSNRNPMTQMAVGVPSETEADAEAERMFRRALEIEPGYAEARVRLARLLDERGRYDEAAEQVDRALAGTLDRVPSFFARLFGGRAAMGRGRFDDALAHYVAASKIYPEAQSALLGASHAAMMASDVPAALSYVRRLAVDPDRRVDPWWDYGRGPGRAVDELLQKVYALVAR